MQKFVITGFSVFIFGCDFGDHKSDVNETLSGGATTVFVENSNAFSTPAANLSSPNFEKHMEGDAAFEQTFVSAPAVVNSGLGPLFNNSSCIGCHTRDGRGLNSLLIRLSVAGSDGNGGPLAAPGFGGQLQTRSIIKTVAEGQIQIAYNEEAGSFADGEPYSLRKPTYTIASPYTALPGGVMMSPRFAPPVFGLGLLETISEADLLANADPDDGDGDGISGKPNYVWSRLLNSARIGRFGWKANQPDLTQQTAAAYNGDMGVTSSIFTEDNCVGQTQCDTLTDDPEIGDDIVDVSAFYVRTLGVPARRSASAAAVRSGKKLFHQGACATCHVPQFKTGTFEEIPELSGQTIFPYTDLLLHDMGPGLADNRPDFLASGAEWRTAPLWGIGLTELVNGHTFFLHDGRARNLTEAILWHGGEAEAAKQFFRNLTAGQRAELLAFLNSL